LSLIDVLGIDEYSVHWQDLASCRNIVQVYEEDGKNVVFDPMFDAYEEDSDPFIVRKTIDEMCLSCPVQKICYEYGTNNMEPGVWGGVYLINGKHDRTRNSHKTRDVWKRVKARVK